MEQYKNKEWLYEKYIKEQLSIQQTAKLTSCNPITIRNWLIKYNIPIRTISEGTKIALNHPLIRKKLGHKRERHHNWRGGRVKKFGYILIKNSDHPHADKNGYVREHRLVMEGYLGRHLYPWEVVHHRNGIRDDNRIENLELISAHGRHNKIMNKVFIENKQLKQIIWMMFMLLKENYRDHT